MVVIGRVGVARFFKATVRTSITTSTSFTREIFEWKRVYIIAVLIVNRCCKFEREG